MESTAGEDGWIDPSPGLVAGPETTGKLLVYTPVVRAKAGGATAGSLKSAADSLSDAIGVEVVHSSELGDGDELREQLGPDTSVAIMLDDLGVTVVDAAEDFQQRLTAACADPKSNVALVEPDRVVHATSLAYVEGFREGVNSLVDSIRSNGFQDKFVPASLPGGPFADDANFTWGLRAIGAAATPDLGAGARVAVLDTGVDSAHPDLSHAIVATQSFISGETADDGHGHGTHCCGTIAGRRTPSGVPRFGVAPDAKLLAGKVLSNAGSGSDAGILAGIQWAILNDCHIVSMSLGARVSAGTPFSQIFETVARSALEANTIIVVAAGNDSRRPSLVNPISHPANCPSIIAVAALDQSLAPASFSNAGRVGQDHIAIGGPGVRVLSAAPGGGHRFLSGTSMATPHVAGVAAVLVARESIEGPALTMRLLLDAQGLLSPGVDVGTGLASVTRA